MNEHDLIRKLQTLRVVEADQEWFVSARHNMLNIVDSSTQTKRIPSFEFVFSAFSLRACLAMAGFLFIALASGMLSFANNSLPGDPLYNVKLSSESAQNSLPASATVQAQRQEAVAQRRVDELTQVAQNITQSSNAGKKDMSPAIAKQIESYNQTLQQNAQTLSQSSNTGQNQSNNNDIEKVKSEAGIIQQSAQTLAIVLHQADNSADMEKALRATIGSRLPACKDQQMLSQVQKLLSSDEIADLIEANELSVRCTEAN